MNRKIFISVVVICIIAGLIWFSQKQAQVKRPEEFKGITDKLTIGFYPANSNALLFIAERQGFFSHEGLGVTLRAYPTGKQALKGMYDGEVSLSTVGDMAIVFNSFEKQDFSIFATVGSSENEFKIVANKEKVKGPEDFKGKHIATVKGTQMNFFMHLFLRKHGLSDNESQISFMPAEELPQALVTGQIDAASTREPIISQAKRLLGDNALVFEEPGFFTATANLTALNNFIKDKPGVIKRILKGLIEAEGFIRSHPDQAIKIVADKMKVSESEAARFWQEHNLRVSLSQSLILVLEDEARWIIGSRLTDKKVIPNYLNFIYLDGLDAVKPDAVTIIR
ncbi:MAG: ABC transporter substrate-binding protein [Nitrospinae bacterium]|nr:ABC transporter substrate-binding protein [Nitrospinota bacterium]